MSFLSRQRRRRQWIRSRLNRYKCVCVCWGAIYVYIYTPYLELCLTISMSARNTPTLDAVADAYWGRVPVCLKNFSVDCNKRYRNTLYLKQSTLQSLRSIQTRCCSAPFPPLVTSFYFSVISVFYGFLTSFKAPFDL